MEKKRKVPKKYTAGLSPADKKMTDVKKVVSLHVPKSKLDEQFLTLEAQRQVIRNQAKEISERVRLAAGK